MAASYRRESFFMKKFFISLLIGLATISNAFTANAAEAPVFDTAKLSSGIVAVSYSTPSTARLKVMVEKSGQKITYNLRGDGAAESYPLQMGDGEYKVSVLENIEDNKYKYISTRNITLDLSDDKQVYLESVQNINWNGNMAAIKKAVELTKGLNTDSSKIDAIYRYIVGNIKYDYDKLTALPSDYNPVIDNTISGGKGICYDYAALFAAMLRSQGIPAKLVKGYTPNAVGYHAWNEIYDSKTGKWITADTTYDAQLKALNRKYKMTKDQADYSKVYEY